MSSDFFDPYSLWKKEVVTGLSVPKVDYLPPKTSYPEKIGLIGCNDEAFQILTAYLRADYNVVAISGPDPALTKNIRDTFYPAAKMYGNHIDLLNDPAVNIVDVSSPTSERFQLLADAMRAGKHVLSQKYFVDDLDRGEELVRLARECGVKFAVNEDARWAPAYKFAAEMVKNGSIGDVLLMNFLAIWNHNYIKGTPLEDQKYCIALFGAAWFDLINVFMQGAPAKRVYATVARTPGQEVRPPLLMQTNILYEHAQANIALLGDADGFSIDRMALTGDKGVINSIGPERGEQNTWLGMGTGMCKLQLEGDWLPGGFHGSMAELVKSVEEDREPDNSGANVLKSYALSFAAIASAEYGRPMIPGEPDARKLVCPQGDF
ncbi:MAG: Gfo/Idh/MocA family oxidoreductase [Planctomycetota bacterium]|jgi:predicted dehydrogenase|nr:Gfo/Idh/MocA family oxidoreductase [Planctomycetota bacterium]